MTSKDTLPVANHYHKIGKYQQAYDQLVSMKLHIDREDHIRHYLLLADLLYRLDKVKDSQELTDELLSKFPDNYWCNTQWICQASIDFNRAEEAYELARSMQKTEPDDYWFPMMMAQMAFDFRLESKTTIIELVEHSLAIERNTETLETACKILGHFHKPSEIKPYLDELVELAPEAESTYLLLLEFLEKSKRYTELGQISYQALRKFPDNQALAGYLYMATSYLYEGYLGRLYCLSVNLGKKLLLQRSSTKRWFRIIQSTSSYLIIGIALLVCLLGLIAYGLAALFFFHFFVVTTDERNIKKQKKQRLKIQEFECRDQLMDINGAASVLVTSTHLKYRFVYLNAEKIALARDIWCPVENLHFEFDQDHLPGYESIAHQQIKRIEVSTNYLVIRTFDRKKYTIYYESVETLNFILGQLQQRGFQLSRTRRGSRFCLIALCLCGLKAGFGLACLIFFVHESWKITILVFLMALTNFISLFIYRFIVPIKVDIYQK